MIKRTPMLPSSLPPRGLSRVQAAEYIGVSPTKFDEMVQNRTMPKPKRVGTRATWDRRKLDEAFDALPGDDEVNPWDEVLK
jgi:predicted DNA-binding transcriptional regulator AlpA